MAQSEEEEQDRKYMRIALDEARKGMGKTHPNPCVGCVLVKEGRVVGKGYHPRAGMPHAEAKQLQEQQHTSLLNPATTMAGISISPVQSVHALNSCQNPAMQPCLGRCQGD
eukprot:764443-Hanusia_phi.AAC.6